MRQLAINAHATGATLAFDNGVSEGIAMIKEEVAALERTVAASGTMLETMVQLGAGLPVLGVGTAPIDQSATAQQSAVLLAEQSGVPVAAATQVNPAQLRETIDPRTRLSQTEPPSRTRDLARPSRTSPLMRKVPKQTSSGTPDARMQGPPSRRGESYLPPQNATVTAALLPVSPFPGYMSPFTEAVSLTPTAAPFTALPGLPGIDRSQTISIPISTSTTGIMEPELTAAPQQFVKTTAPVTFVSPVLQGYAVPSIVDTIHLGNTVASPAVSPVRSRGGDITRLSESPAKVAHPHPPETSSEPREGRIILDGAQLGRWVIDHLARHASRPASGMTGIDPRISATYPGAPSDR